MAEKTQGSARRWQLAYIGIGILFGYVLIKGEMASGSPMPPSAER